jgi:hypothetical protein
MVPVGGGIVRLVPAACDDHTAEQTAAGGSWALGVCVRKAVARNNSHTNASPKSRLYLHHFSVPKQGWLKKNMK